MIIALVCSYGGHLTELQFLSEAFKKYEVFFITYENIRTGLMVAPGDPPALADVIDSLLQDAGLRGRIGKNARQTIEARYTWETIADLFEREYRLAMESA